MFGIPLHVWEEEAFKKLGGLFGELLDFHEETIGKQKMDVAKLLVLTGRMGVIDEYVEIKVMWAVYRVWVVEGDDVVEDEGDRCEEDFSDGMDEEEVVGTALGVSSEDEDDDVTPMGVTSVQVDDLEGVYGSECSCDRRRKEEGQVCTFLGSNHKRPSLEFDGEQQQWRVGQVAGTRASSAQE